MNYSGLMDIRNFFYFSLAIFILTTASSCACEEDEFGEVLHMEIPVDTGSERNIFRVGDTLWVEADFPKEVVVVGNNSRIELPDYKFFQHCIYLK
jgi:DNA-binding transcriptional regulator/RsmH inhibitor MraZ